MRALEKGNRQDANKRPGRQDEKGGEQREKAVRANRLARSVYIVWLRRPWRFLASGQ